MANYNFAIYDAFSDRPFGGSQAAIITDAGSIDSQLRQHIAREIGLPATAFVDACDNDSIGVQFMSAVMELPMCGHGTICLLTHLLEHDLVTMDGCRSRELKLRLPKTSASVSIEKTAGRFRVMLAIEPPEFEPPPPHTGELLTLLGLDANALDPDLPLETARGDFIHLVVPLKGLDDMSRIKPDFNAMVDFCHAHGIETVAVFCLEVENPENDLHVRDFCPAVGVSESAAAGTTNAALSSYLIRHGLVPADQQPIRLDAEQGLEIGRPSSIQSVAQRGDTGISQLFVGGVATRVMDGTIYLPD